MDVKNVDISELKPYYNNPRNNEKSVDDVAKSIKKFGWQQPIVVDKDMVIIVGHTQSVNERSEVYCALTRQIN